MKHLPIPPEITEYIARDTSVPSHLIWIKSAARRIKVGAMAGNKRPSGPYQVGFKGKLYLAHRVEYFLLTGEDPKDFEVDHKNHDYDFPTELRLATHLENTRNKKSTPRASKTSRFKGVYWKKDSKKWRANIRVNNKLVNLGNFLCEIEAARAYNKAALEHFGEFAYLNEVE